MTRPNHRDPTTDDNIRSTTVPPGDDCPTCDATVESAAYGVTCSSHRCDWHEYRTPNPTLTTEP